MRTLASLNHYLVTTDESGVQIHLYADASIDASFGQNRRAALSMQTDFPWSGEVTLTVAATDGEPWTLQLRIPDWCKEAEVTINGAAAQADRSSGYAALTRTWQPDDVVRLQLTMQPELLAAHPRIDPARASVALRNGPLVYCLEQADQPAGVNVADVAVTPGSAMMVAWRPELLGGVNVVQLGGKSVNVASWGDALYRPLDGAAESNGEAVELVAVPYYAWANRGPGAMRVWVPNYKG
jgi:DUF1680 family protein